MGSLFVLFITFCVLGCVSCDGNLCGNTSLINTSSCTKQIIGEANGHPEPCMVKVFDQESTACKNMTFGPITQDHQIGSVQLKPYVLELKNDWLNYQDNITVLNISFSNIKWRTMKFRFQRDQRRKNHCSSITISNNVTVNDQSVLYYDCYWATMPDSDSGQSHILDFEAANETTVNRRRFNFNVPSAAMLSPKISLESWIPFTYIETLTDTMKLHILPPPPHLTVHSYRIDVKREQDTCTKCSETVTRTTVILKNKTDEVTFEQSLLAGSGTYYFVVTPLHERCHKGSVNCKYVESPRITINTETHQTLNICIASVTALVVATLFAYYIFLRVVRQCWCKYSHFASVGKEIPSPPKILVVYSTANRLHAECVASFVAYLRTQYGFKVMYDVDITDTPHGDPYLWAEEAFRVATHVIYIAAPSENSNIYNNIYDQPIISPHRDVDTLLLNLIRANKGNRPPKNVVNVIFEHSDTGLPIETKYEKKFYLLKDWPKLIAYLSMDLLPRQQIALTDKGKSFVDDLNRANKLLSDRRDDVVIKCEKSKGSFDKKVLL